MTFGEHLEELRRCLFRALLGLVACVIIGFFLGDTVVGIIKTPLERALKKHLKIVARQAVSQAQAEGQPLPEDPKRMLDLIEDGYIPEEVSFNAAELAALLGQWFPDQLANPEPPEAANPSDQAGRLLRITMWRRLDDDPRVRPKSFGAPETFMIWLKASLLVGVTLAAPWIFYQIWTFVAAGLYPHEKRYVYIYLPFSVGLFLLGVLVAFFWVFDPVLTFMFSFNRAMKIDPDPRITEWLGFFLLLPLGFGIAFQLPLVMLFLQRIGIFTVKGYLAYWRVAILVIFVLAAILTPADPWSMLLLATPLTVLYFCGVLLCQWMPRGPLAWDEDDGRD